MGRRLSSRLSSTAGARGIRGLALAVAAYSGAKCKSGEKGLIVCGNAFNPGGGGTTIGDVFITSSDTDRVLRNKDLQAHEVRHSAQWAAWGYGYPLAYATGMAESQMQSSGYACMNYFEIDAGMYGGGYYDACE